MRLKEHGAELVEVADNGCGVEPGSYAALTAKYHTSKARRLRCGPGFRVLAGGKRVRGARR